MNDARIRRRRDDGEGRGSDRDRVVVLWMQRSQRTRGNPSLEHAIRCANELDTTVVSVFCLRPDFPDASARHLTFMLEGLSEVTGALRRRKIRSEAFLAEPAEVFSAIDHRIALLVTDAGHLPFERRWRDEVEAATTCAFHEVEGDLVVPHHLVTDTLESAARTIRPKIHEHLDDLLDDLAPTTLQRSSLAGGDRPVQLSRSASGIDTVDLNGLDRSGIVDLLDSLGVDPEPAPVDTFHGGERAAHRALEHFCDHVLPDYAELRNRYDLDDSCSKLSPYLHFGQISPVDVVLAARDSAAPDDDVDAFVEEVVVRRELAANLARHGDDIDAFAGLPDWARDTLTEHRDDPRPEVYTASELERGETDDEVWNTIMHVIRRDGWVHNQLRMYWGKQVIAWTNTPGHAFRTLLSLNNRWFLDGRDANSYANVAWCFGRHDRGFAERDILGKVRPFTDQALRRKGDLDAWVSANAPS